MPKLPRSSSTSINVVIKYISWKNCIRTLFNYHTFCQASIENDIHIFGFINELN